MIALITGASRGIGRAIALRFARVGNVKLCLCYRRNQAAAETVALACEDLGAEVFLVQADISDSNAASDLVHACVERFGHLDVLVNNAGMTADQLSMKMKDDDWHAVLKTNLDSAFYTSRIASKTMMKRRFGRIINMSSVAARRPNRGQVNYAASKGALEALTRALAVELGSRNITVNAVAPGIIETDMSEQLRQRAEAQLVKSIPIPRFGQSDEVADLVYFLASDKAGYITGQTIGVDGGLSLS